MHAHVAQRQRPVVGRDERGRVEQHAQRGPVAPRDRAVQRAPALRAVDRERVRALLQQVPRARRVPARMAASFSVSG